MSSHHTDQNQKCQVTCAQDTPRVAKCHFFTQIISLQLNLPQEKARKLREVFDILSIK